MPIQRKQALMKTNKDFVKRLSLKWSLRKETSIKCEYGIKINYQSFQIGTPP